MDEEEEEQEAEIVTQPAPAPSTTSIDIPPKSVKIVGSSIHLIVFDFRRTTHNRPGIDSEDASPAMLDHYLHQAPTHYHNITPNDTGMHQDHGVGRSDDEDEDDDLPLGGEASTDLIENMSDDEGHTSRNFNVSPTVEGDDEENDKEPPPLISEHQLIQQSEFSVRKQPRTNDGINRSIAFQIDNTFNRDGPTHKSYHKPDLYDHEMNDSAVITPERTKTNSANKSLVVRRSPFQRTGR